MDEGSPKPAKRNGRPPRLLSADLRERILRAIRGGSYREVAARWCGVSPDLLSRWMGRKEEPYASFRHEVYEAEAEAEVRMASRIMAAAAEDPNHAKWYLERKFPERWGRRDTHMVTGADGKELIPLDVLRSAVARVRDGREVDEPSDPT